MSEETFCAYHVRRREFLNEDLDLPAFIIGIVEDTRAIPNDDLKGWSEGEITLDLGDCYRRVRFDFLMYDADERAKSLRKINLIAEVVNAVRDGIALEVESRNERPVAPSEAESVQAEAEPEGAEVQPAQFAVEAPTAAVATTAATAPARTGNQQFFTSYITTLGL